MTQTLKGAGIQRKAVDEISFYEKGLYLLVKNGGKYFRFDYRFAGKRVMLKRSMVLLFLMILAVMIPGVVSAQPKGGTGDDGGPGWNVMKNDDNDGDMKISSDEFSGPPSDFSKIDKNGDGFLTEVEVGPGQKRPRQVDKGPKSGVAAPAIKLVSLDGKDEFDLASFKGKKPVVLFFGSYT